MAAQLGDVYGAPVRIHARK